MQHTWKVDYLTHKQLERFICIQNNYHTFIKAFNCSMKMFHLPVLVSAVAQL